MRDGGIEMETTGMVDVKGGIDRAQLIVPEGSVLGL